MLLIERLRFTETPPSDVWPFYLPAVRDIVDHGLQFTKPITFLVGDNGVGKSTLIESIAITYGLDVRGGHGNRRYGAAREINNPLGRSLKLQLSPHGRRTKAQGAQGFFLRAETSQGVFEYMSDFGVQGYGDRHLGAVSHGEGYLQVLFGRFKGPGLFLLDEPESPLSFDAQLVFMKQLMQLSEQGAQVICATHSPILTAMPGVNLMELDDTGIHERKWQDLKLAHNWQHFMANPDFYLNDLFA